MSLTIEATAYLEYNGIYFGKEGTSSKGEISFNLSHADFRVASKNLYNAGEPAVEGIDYTIQVQAFLVAGDSFNREEALEHVRVKLMEPQGVLVAFGMGIDTRNGGGVLDISWGPKPVDFSTHPIGDLGSVINWTVQFRIPPCSTLGDLTYGALKSFSNSSVFSNNAEGIETRTNTAL